MSEGSSLVAVRRLLTAVASPGAERRLGARRLLTAVASLVGERRLGERRFSLQWLLVAERRLGARRLQYLWSWLSSLGFETWSTGSTAVAPELSCSAACGIFLDQELNLCLLHWQGDSLPPSHQESPGWLSLIFTRG